MSSEIEDIIKQEGDNRDFTHKGLQCHIERHRTLKHLCGYVGISKNHPLYQRGYSENLCSHSGCYEHSVGSIFEVHGGLTFANEAYWQKTKDGLWYFGFDCGHAGDLVCGADVFGGAFEGDIYRNINYVEEECKSLAGQLLKYKRSQHKFHIGSDDCKLRLPSSKERKAIIER